MNRLLLSNINHGLVCGIRKRSTSGMERGRLLTESNIALDVVCLLLSVWVVPGRILQLGLCSFVSHTAFKSWGR